MYIDADIQIGNEQAKQFAATVYDDFIEYLKSRKTDPIDNNHIINKTLEEK